MTLLQIFQNSLFVSSTNRKTFLFLAREWHFIVFATDGIYCTSKSEYRINLSKTALKKDLESMREDVKQVLGVIVGLLKDRISVDNSPASKKARIKKFTEE